NPLATVPHQNRVRTGLSRGDLFTVVFEQSMTDTAKYADVILPATTFFEHWDIAKGYGAYHLQVVQPVIAPVGEARPNHEVFRELGIRLGLTEDVDDGGEAGALMDVLGKVPAQFAPALRDGEPAPGVADGHPIQFVNIMPKTADAKAHLFPQELASLE